MNWVGCWLGTLVGISLLLVVGVRFLIETSDPCKWAAIHSRWWRWRWLVASWWVIIWAWDKMWIGFHQRRKHLPSIHANDECDAPFSQFTHISSLFFANSSKTHDRSKLPEDRRLLLDWIVPTVQDLRYCFFHDDAYSPPSLPPRHQRNIMTEYWRVSRHTACRNTINAIWHVTTASRARAIEAAQRDSRRT